MRIGIDARNLVPSLTGIGRYVLEMARALGAAGHELCLYLPEPAAAPLAGIVNARVRVGAWRGATMRMLWAQTALPAAARADAVDVFWGPAHRLPAALPGTIARVVTIHDLVWVHAAATMRRQTWLGERFLVGPALRRADRIVTDSNATTTDLQRRFPDIAAPVSTIYPGVTPLAAARANAAPRPAGGRHYILFVGTLEPRKNLARLIAAFAALPEPLRADHALVIAGGTGWRADDLERLAGAHGLADSVKTLGYVSDADLAALYAGATCLAMPSLYEGFGLPILEAHRFGVPVLTSRVSSMPEVAGKAAVLVDPFSVPSIAEGLRTLIGDPARRAALAQHARANAARFDWDRSASQLAGVFEAAIAQRRGNR